MEVFERVFLFGDSFSPLPVKTFFSPTPRVEHHSLYFQCHTKKHWQKKSEKTQKGALEWLQLNIIFVLIKDEM